MSVAQSLDAGVLVVVAVGELTQDPPEVVFIQIDVFAPYGIIYTVQGGFVAHLGVG
jgi:hypothetical protein